MAEGVGAVEVQRGGNMAYQSLETHERKIYQERTYDANHNSNKVKEFCRFMYPTGLGNCFQHRSKYRYTVTEHVVGITMTFCDLLSPTKSISHERKMI